MQFRDLQRQYTYLKPEMDAAVLKAMGSGAYIAGPEVKQLEQELAAYVGRKHCITCANGTDALSLTLTAWGVGEGDAVFVPDLTFFASAEAPAVCGATPFFVDVREDTFNLDPARLEEAILAVRAAGKYRPRAVIVVDLYGQTADFTAIRPLCEKYGLLLLEDGAQGFGGTLNGQRACSFGNASTTSFFPAKPLGCYGDGGAIFTDDDATAALLRSLVVHGRGATKYENVRIGVNSRLDTVQAAVLLVKLHAFIAQELAQVNQVTGWYDAAFAGSPLRLPAVPQGFCSSWAQYTVTLPEGTNRDAVQAKLKQQGIPTMVYYPVPMHEQGAFAGTDSTVADCPVTQRLVKTILSLPIGPYLTQDEVQTVARALRAAL